ncbi:MAG: hypothetical protein U9N42_02260 [Campylobacterota bacterium]|nr:hypothetical protein [Campylobacterota bacterium]
MKKILLSLFIVASLSASQNDIEQLISDITDLRYNYEICKGKLDKIKLSQTYDESENSEVYAKNIQLKNELVRLKKELKSRKSSANLITELKQKNSSLLNEVEDLQKVSQTLRDELKRVQSSKRVVIPKLNTAVKKTPMPQIMKVKKVEIEVEEIVEKPKRNIKMFKASSFRLLNDAPIYDAPNGEILENWSAKTSFTSNQNSDGFIKITGYFVDGKWVPTGKDRSMWIEGSKVIKR